MPFKVLIADDDAAMLKALSLRIGNAGYSVLAASDADEAVALARSDRPDLLLLDMHLATNTGFMVHERVWRIVGLRRTPIVYLTGDTSRTIANTAHTLGAVAVIHKPFVVEQLLDVLKTALATDANLAA